MRNDKIRKIVQECGVNILANGRGVYTYNSMDIHLECDISGESVYLFYCVGTWPAHPPIALVENILKANFFGASTRGGHLGLQGEHGALVYSLRLNATSLTAQTLQNAVHLFANTAVELAKNVEDWSKSDTQAIHLQQEIISPLMVGIRV